MRSDSDAVPLRDGVDLLRGCATAGGADKAVVSLKWRIRCKQAADLLGSSSHTRIRADDLPITISLRTTKRRTLGC